MANFALLGLQVSQTVGYMFFVFFVFFVVDRTESDSIPSAFECQLSSVSFLSS